MGKKQKKLLLALSLLALAGCLLLPFLWGRAVDVFAPPGSQVELPVIMYHSLVKNDAQAAEYICPISRVESDLAWLEGQGYESVTLAQLSALSQGKGTLPAKPVLITLDDGYRNNQTLLPPLLEKYNMKAVIGIVGEYTDVYTACGDDGSRHACMSWEDAANAVQSPRLELANHSYYFHHLSSRKGSAKRAGESLADWQAALTSDTMAMQNAIEEHCGMAPLAYAYPFGQITPGADSVMEKLGIHITFSCNEMRSVITSGQGGLYSLGRFNRDGRMSTQDFMNRLFRE